MSDEVVDFSGYDMSADTESVDTSFSLIPPGLHQFRIKKVEWRMDKERRPELNLQLDVVSDEFAGVVFHTLRLFNPKCREFSMKDLARLSLSCFGSKIAFKNHADYMVFEGKVCKASIKHEEYNGSTNAKVRFFDEKNDPSYIEANLASRNETYTEVQQQNNDEAPF